ncbi:unnamed protein product [Owenia fusiformis]|uniref:CRAL-TRIO domain-containing protein n=1 Tax=Owenia fusiformis TaxID=6347 RepID=A0A8S4PXD1_OWEFU|nr:unnamed protein product [Owenia fusiformis]
MLRRKVPNSNGKRKKDNEDDKYVCTLDDASLGKAERELNEDPVERHSAVLTLRQWVQTQQHLRCRTDMPFLLRFLRCAKFCQLRARKTIENYLDICSQMPEWFSDVDTTDENILKYFKSGLFLVLPGRDDEGRKIFVFRPEVYDLHDKSLNSTDMGRACVGMLLYLLRDEATQINGIVALEDRTNFTMSHMKQMAPTFTKGVKCFMGGQFPLRYKAIHWYNSGALTDALMTLIKPFMQEKLRQRVQMHGNSMESVFECIPMRLLPSEYLPDDYDGPTNGTRQQCIDWFLAELTNENVRREILDDTSDKYGIDIDKKPPEDKTVTPGSFRRLSSTESKW